MKPIEIFPSSSQEKEGTTIEPLPTTAEALLAHVAHIEGLWKRHADALQTGAREELAAIKQSLLEAYRTIVHSADFISEDTTELLIDKETLEAARFELWFARHHLDKVIK